MGRSRWIYVYYILKMVLFHRWITCMQIKVRSRSAQSQMSDGTAIIAVKSIIISMYLRFLWENFAQLNNWSSPCTLGVISLCTANSMCQPPHSNATEIFSARQKILFSWIQYIQKNQVQSTLICFNHRKKRLREQKISHAATHNRINFQCFSLLNIMILTERLRLELKFIRRYWFEAFRWLQRNSQQKQVTETFSYFRFHRNYRNFCI